MKVDRALAGVWVCVAFVVGWMFGRAESADLSAEVNRCRAVAEAGP